ncbi:hypothetical protein [Fretibacterium sp. OH1220_COT-178]|uniref:hypothetical protein n=1 Tax=Fretibacterium sp. OH1220_COT-178 TaxID=2491047 RepID=UPI000F5ED95F|nr:hypothetical protein [Fretibacterium sp. OH1220_COT-178]RRD65706.1 hypothetical protein EII26_03015 [Fretibacterium sp. OH1220_COT-178]
MAASRMTAVFLSLSVLLWGTCAFGAEQGAVAAARAKRAAADKAAEKAEGGSDLKAIATPKKKATTFTGFPAGTLPSGEAPKESKPQPDGAAVSPSTPGRVVPSGDPLIPIISSAQVGLTLDRIYAIADHAGYSLLLNKRYVPTALDSPYSYLLVRGKQRMARLFFDRSLKLTLIE